MLQVDGGIECRRNLLNMNFRKKFWGLYGPLMALLLSAAFIVAEMSFFKTAVFSDRINVNVFTLHWMLMIVLRLIMYIATDVACIWFVRQMSSVITNIGDTFKLWLSAVAMGLIFAVYIAGFTFHRIYAPGFFNSIFLITRNSAPFVSGLILGSLVIDFVRKILLTRNGRIITWIVLLLPIVAGRNIFSIGNGLTFWGAVAFIFVSEATKYYSIKRSVEWIVGGATITLLLQLMMVPISKGLTGSLSLTAQFAGNMSPFILVSAAGIVNILMSVKVKEKGEFARFFELTLMVGVFLLFNSLTFSQILNNVMTFSKESIGERFGIWMVLDATVLIGGLLVCAALVTAFLRNTWIWKATTNLEFHNINQITLNRVMSSIRLILGQYWPAILAFVTFYVVQVCSALLMNQHLKTVEIMMSPNQSIFMYTLVKRAPAMLFGAMILMMLFYFIKSLTNRYWVSLISVHVFVIVWTVANVMKIKERSEPILLGDLYEIKAISELASMIGSGVIIFGLIGLAAVITLVFFLEKNCPVQTSTMFYRLIMLVVSVMFFAGFKTINHPKSFMHNFSINFRNTAAVINQIYGAQSNGPVLQFLNGIDTEAMAEPSDYSKSKIKRLVNKYQNVARSINRGRKNSIGNATVVFNLSESFSDPSRLPELSLNKDPIPNVHNLIKNNTSGLMMSYGYGGGTANMEWETLTGNAMGNLDTGMTTPYTQLVLKQRVVPTINQYFPYSAAIHPYLGTFYGRTDAYAKFGFNKFSYLGSKYPIKFQKKLGNSSYMSDYTAYKNALSQINSKKGSQFINLVTMQNHMPFSNRKYSDHDFTVSGGAYGNANGKGPLEGYIQGINYSDTEIERFKEEIDNIHKPIIWVWYGDHLPALFSGINTAANSVLLHQTDFFIYVNKFAREHGMKTNVGNHLQIGANDFEALAFKSANAKVDPYNALLTKVQEELPTIWQKTSNSTTSPLVGMNFVKKNGKTESYSNLTKKQKTVLKDFQLIQYDIDAGKQYSLSEGLVKY
jgi:phosphoglycerol transferase MdoB-like AlkP superfamily enzyme